MNRTEHGENGGSSLIKIFASLIVGAALGIALAGQSSDGGAQASYDQGTESFQDALNAGTGPSVSVSPNGQTKFSRPLEVPPLYAFDSPLDENGRQIVLVDSESKRICVYWVRQRGVNSTIELVATRNFELDLKLENFNGEGLSPAQIREQLNSTQH